MTMPLRDRSNACERAPSGNAGADFNWPPSEDELGLFQLTRPQSTTADTSAGDHGAGSVETSADAGTDLSGASVAAIPDGEAALEPNPSEQSRTRRRRVTLAAEALIVRTLVAAAGVAVGVMLAVWLRVGVRTPEPVIPADRSTSNPAPTPPIVSPPVETPEPVAPARADSAANAAPGAGEQIRPPAAGQGGIRKPAEAAAGSAPAGVSAPSQLLSRVLIDPIPVTVPPRLEAPVGQTASPPAPEGPPAVETAAKPSVPAAGVPDDRSAIQEVLQRYERAYAALDARAAAAVWPSVDERALQKAFSLLQFQELVFRRCDVATAGFHATAQCSGELRYVPRVGQPTVRTQSHSWTFQLDRVGEEWRVTSVNGR
jgi:hypothetical protein